MILIQTCCEEQPLEEVVILSLVWSCFAVYMFAQLSILHLKWTGPPESVFDWTKEIDSDLANQNGSNQVFSRKYWRLLQCQNGLYSVFIFIFL